MDRQVGHKPLQPDILLFKLFESLRLIELQSTVFLAPPVVSLVRDSDLLADRWHGEPLGGYHLGLPELAYDLLGRERLPWHVSAPSLLPGLF